MHHELESNQNMLDYMLNNFELKHLSSEKANEELEEAHKRVSEAEHRLGKVVQEEYAIQKAEEEVQEAMEELRGAEREEYVAKLAEHLEIQSYLHLFNYMTSNYELKHLALDEAQVELAIAQQKFMEAKNRLERLHKRTKFHISCH